MLEKKIIAKNFLWHTSARVLNKAVRFLFFIFLASLLGPFDYGVYTYVLSIVGMGLLFSDWGVNILLVRDFQQSQQKESVFSTALVLKMCILALCGIVTLCVSFFFSVHQPVLIFGVFSALFFESVSQVFINLFLAQQKASREFFVYLFDSIFLTVLFFVFFFPHPTVLRLVAMYAGCAFMTLCVSYAVARQTIAISFKSFNTHIFLSFLRNGFALSLFGLSSYIFFSTDQIILKHFWGYYELGQYSFASKIILSLLILPSFFTAVVMPVISRSVDNTAAMYKLVKGSLAFLLVMGVSVSALLALCAPVLVPLLTGSEYLPAIPLTKWLALMLIPAFAVTILDYILIAYNLQLKDFFITLGAALVNLILNFILIPQYGMFGAVWASVVSQFLNFILTFLFVLFVLRKRTQSQSIQGL